MSEAELLSRLQSQTLEIEMKGQEALKRLKLLYEEYMKKPLDEQLKMAREALDHGHH